MHVNNWKYVKPLDDISLIRKLENKMERTLPNDYVEFVIKHHAGRPSANLFKTLNGDERVFLRLISFDESQYVNMFTTFESFSSYVDATHLLPFANDPFGNYICFDFSENPAEVVFWDHETNKLDTVSKTFTDLVCMLYKTE